MDKVKAQIVKHLGKELDGVAYALMKHDYSISEVERNEHQYGTVIKVTFVTDYGEAEIRIKKEGV